MQCERRPLKFYEQRAGWATSREQNLNASHIINISLNSFVRSVYVREIIDHRDFAGRYFSRPVDGIRESEDAEGCF